MCANGDISSNITYEESKRNILMKSVCSRKAFLKIIGQLIPLSNGVSTKSTRFQVRSTNIFIFQLFKTGALLGALELLEGFHAPTSSGNCFFSTTQIYFSLACDNKQSWS